MSHRVQRASSHGTVGK